MQKKLGHRVFFVREGQTIFWQPKDYDNYVNIEEGPVFEIKLMTDVERRHWERFFLEQAQRKVEEASDRVREQISQNAMDELISNYVVSIHNVPKWVVQPAVEDPSYTDLIVVRKPDLILMVINSLPANDGKLLDRAVWDINELSAGEVKNFKSSPASLPTSTDEPPTDADPAEASSAS